MLQDLADFLKTETNATASYIGKLTQPKKPINDDDDDRAHEDPDAPNIIHFLTATEDFMKDEVLTQEQGLTFDVFKEDEEQPPAEEENAEEEEDGVEKPPKEPEEVFPKHVYVAEVVREPRMHYYRVPRLGCYLAIKLEYESCLFEEALDAAVADYLDVQTRKEEQDKEKQEYFSKMQSDRDEGREEAQEEGQTAEEKEWVDIEPAPYLTRKETFVVCLNTMGQDREFTKEEKEFALREAQRYRDRWEQLEKENLEADVLRRVQNMAQDKEYKELYEQIDLNEIEKEIEDHLAPREGEDPMTEEEKALEAKKKRLAIWTRMFYAPQAAADTNKSSIRGSQQSLKKEEEQKSKQADEAPSRDSKDTHPASKKEEPPKPKASPSNQSANANTSNELKDTNSQAAAQNEGPSYQALQPEQWKEKIKEFTEYTVIKMPRVWQALFYLLKHKREDLCERDTNKLLWKKAKEFVVDDLFRMIGEYEPFGPKEEEFKAYQTINFIERILEGIDPEAVDDYSVALGKLYRWLLLAIETRKEDVQARKEKKEKLKEERQQAIELAEEWENNKQRDLEAA